MDKDNTTFEKGDEVWDILENASETSPKPMFVQDVLRSVRNIEEVSPPWWKRIFSPAPSLIGASLAAAIVVTIYFNTRNNSEQASPDTEFSQATNLHSDDSTATISLQDDAELINEVIATSEDDDLIGEYLVSLAENADLLSDEDISNLFSL